MKTVAFTLLAFLSSSGIFAQTEACLSDATEVICLETVVEEGFYGDIEVPTLLCVKEILLNGASGQHYSKKIEMESRITAETSPSQIQAAQDFMSAELEKSYQELAKRYQSCK